MSCITVHITGTVLYSLAVPDFLDVFQDHLLSSNRLARVRHLSYLL